VSEADLSPPSSAKVKKWVELCLHFLHTPSRRGSRLKHLYLPYTLTLKGMKCFY